LWKTICTPTTYALALRDFIESWSSFSNTPQWKDLNFLPHEWNPSLSYILIPININESKCVKTFISAIFETITTPNSINFIHFLSLHG
jgi:hypothetical protein